MIEALITLAILALVVGFIAWIVILLVEKIPMDATFMQIARAAIIIIAVLIILLYGLLPLIHVLPHVG